MALNLLLGLGLALQASTSIYAGVEGASSAAEAARIREEDAAYTRVKGFVDEINYRRTLKKTLGAGQAVAGATGFGQEGTNAELLDQMRQEGEIDAAMIRLGAETSAWSSEAEAKLERKRGRTAAVTTGLTALSSMAQTVGTSLSNKSSSDRKFLEV